MKKAMYFLSLAIISFVIGCDSEPEVKPISVTGVSVDTNSKTLVEGENFTLTATVLPEDADNKTVTWRSSDENIAVVGARGMVTAKSPGEATITVTTQDGNFTASCEVTVNRKEVSVAGVVLDVIDKTLTEGEKFILIATILPENADNKSVTWASSDEEVAVVDSDGEVTAISKGEAIISVTTQDGNKVATCTVKVEGEPVPVTGVTLDETEVSIPQGQSVTLIATVLPEDADNKEVTWSSSDEAIVEVDANGKVSAKSVGEATVTATTSEGGFTTTCAITVEKTDVIILTTGINVGSSIWLRMRVVQGEAADVWIDLNNNGVKDIGEQVPIANLNNASKSYVLGSNTIKIYGKLDIFQCNNQKVTYLDASSSSKLLTLNAKDNPGLNALNLSGNEVLSLVEVQDCDYSAADLNAMFESLLPKPSTPGAWRNIRITGNPGIADANLSIAEDKGWEITKE